jgi:hypothetical protein
MLCLAHGGSSRPQLDDTAAPFVTLGEFEIGFGIRTADQLSLTLIWKEVVHGSTGALIGGIAEPLGVVADIE